MKKIKKWVDIYIKHVEEITSEIHVRDEEGYKFKSVDMFQSNFNIDASDLVLMLEQSIEQNNLVAGNMYFPKGVLLLFAQKYERKTREILKTLFNEKKEVGVRINEAEEKFNQILKTWNKEQKDKMEHTFINLRFLSLLLGFRFPNSCNAIKPREWNMFCKYIDDDFRIPQHARSGQKYNIFESYIERLCNYIKQIPEIKKIKDQLTRGLKFEDKGFHWMTQDVIYVTARVLAEQRSKEKIQQEQAIILKNTIDVNNKQEETESSFMEFPLEEYLENFIVRNWNNINFGESLELYIDDDGAPAQQYPTGVGIIDLLAKDAKGNFVVIELKKGRSNQQVVGQILSYVGWVKNNLAEKGQEVRGIIIAADSNRALLEAVSTVQDFILVKYYRVKFNFDNPIEEQK